MTVSTAADTPGRGPDRTDGRLSAPAVPILVLLACGCSALALVPLGPAGARVVAAAFLFAGAPGLGWASVLRLDGDGLRAATSVLLLSVAADVLVAEVVMSAASLRWVPCAMTLIALSALGAGLQLVLPSLRLRRAAPSPRGAG